MRSADLDLYEYKANPAAGVPVQRVRLASPAALGASYTLTFPAALPTGTTLLSVSSSGTVSASVQWQSSIAFALLGDATALLLAGASGTTTPRLSLSTSLVEHVLPIVIPAGSTITSWQVLGNKQSASGTISAKLFESALQNGVGGATQIGATQSNSAVTPGNITLGQGGLSFVTTAGRQYYITLQGGGTGGDIFTIYSVTTS